jgi:hypothetical protein
MVNLPATSGSVGRVNVAYLPLQGRAIASITALMPSIELGLGSDTFIEPLATTISFVLNGNLVQQRSAAVPVPDNISRPFSDFYVNITTLIDNESGAPQSFGDANSPFVSELAFPATIRVFPGRETTVPIFMNDSMIAFVGDPPQATFDQAAFTARNGNPVQGFISDFLSFDISSMAGNRPTMTNGQPADRALFSGDKFAFCSGGTTGYFEMITDNLTQPDKGEFTAPSTIGSSSSPGIYRTIAPDPTDPTNTNTITKIFGIFRNFVDPTTNSKSMVVNTGHFEVILMPKTPDDDNLQILLMSMDGSKVTNMYWGDALLSTGSFIAYPLENIYSGSIGGSIQGTLTGFLNSTANPVTVASPQDARNVRYGRYQISTVLPSGFSRSGRFIVFRK